MLLRASLLLTISLAAILRPAFAWAPASSETETRLRVIDEISNRDTFITHAQLARLPQITTRLQPDENFPELSAAGDTVTGVDLGALLTMLAPHRSDAALVVICRDGYVSPFPRSAIAAHHPLLVIKIDGLSPRAWASKHHTYNPGPYFVTYADFAPSFHVLTHADYPQHPAEIVRFNLVPEADLFRAMAPPQIDHLPSGSAVLAGFRIAQQNCFRCHNAGSTGGKKANVSWQRLKEVAKSRPDYFGRWVHNPQAIDPHSEMPPNLQYDRRTLDALTRYFQALAP